MLKSAHRLMLALIVFAMTGGLTMHLAQPLQVMAPATMADMPCDMMARVTDVGHSAPMLPCKGMTPDCIKQIGCVVDVALPVRLASADAAVTFSAVDYWSTWSEMVGVVRAPEPLPPRTI